MMFDAFVCYKNWLSWFHFRFWAFLTLLRRLQAWNADFRFIRCNAAELLVVHLKFWLDRCWAGTGNFTLPCLLRAIWSWNNSYASVRFPNILHIVLILSVFFDNERRITGILQIWLWLIFVKLILLVFLSKSNICLASSGSLALSVDDPNFFQHGAVQTPHMKRSLLLM